jgi:hypothetical protein
MLSGLSISWESAKLSAPEGPSFTASSSGRSAGACSYAWALDEMGARLGAPVIGINRPDLHAR